MAEKPCHNDMALQLLPTFLFKYFSGGGERDRTDDLLVANQALSQLSYTPDLTIEYRVLSPEHFSQHSALDLVGLGRFELPTSRLSGVRSNRLSYRPFLSVIALQYIERLQD
jgi:hypothetical protein